MKTFTLLNVGDIISLKDKDNKPIFHPITGKARPHQYKFSEVLQLGNILKQYALKYLNNLQDIEFAQSPEYKLMLELLAGEKKEPVKDLVEGGPTTIKTTPIPTPTPIPSPSGPISPTTSPIVSTEPSGKVKMNMPLSSYVPISYNQIYSAVKYILVNIPLIS